MLNPWLGGGNLPLKQGVSFDPVVWGNDRANQAKQLIEKFFSYLKARVIKERDRAQILMGHGMLIPTNAQAGVLWGRLWISIRICL